MVHPKLKKSLLAWPNIYIVSYISKNILHARIKELSYEINGTLKGIHSQRFSFISGDSGYRDKQFATIFTKIDPAVLKLW